MKTFLKPSPDDDDNKPIFLYQLFNVKQNHQWAIAELSEFAAAVLATRDTDVIMQREPCTSLGNKRTHQRNLF